MSFGAASFREWLSEIGLPCIEPLGQLLKRFDPQPDGWSERPILEVPVSATDLPGCDRAQTSVHETALRFRSAHLWTCYLRASSDPKTNFDTWCKPLEERFGPGRSGQAVNTWSRHWRDGCAALTLRAFKPGHADQFGPNARHDAIPGSKTEASLTIRPDAWPPLTRDEVGLLGTAKPLQLPHAPRISLGQDFDDLSRPIEPMLGQGVYLKNWTLIAADGAGRAVIRPLPEVTQVEHVILLPARGSGWSSVRLLLQIGAAQRTVPVLSGAHDDVGLATFAAALGDALMVAVHTHEGLDD